MRLVSRFVLALVGLLTIMIWAVQARSYDDGALLTLLQAPQGCSAPCFMDIQPGVTSGDDALRILKQQKWVDTEDLSSWTDPLSGLSWISWVWNGTQPEGLVRGGYLNYSIYEDRLVRVLIVTSSFKLGDMVLGLGEPEMGSLTERQHIATFPQAHLFIVNDMDCLRFWQGRTDIYFMAAERFAEFKTSFDMHPYNWILENRRQFCRGNG